ncbi:hypothetical protein ACLBVB_32190, partial [Pseudomonas aeruginosa]
MNTPQSSRRPAVAVVMQSLLWLWLLGLSVIVALGYQAMSDQADEKRLHFPFLSGLRQTAGGWEA